MSWGGRGHVDGAGHEIGVVIVGPAGAMRREAGYFGKDHDGARRRDRDAVFAGGQSHRVAHHRGGDGQVIVHRAEAYDQVGPGAHHEGEAQAVKNLNEVPAGGARKLRLWASIGAQIVCHSAMVGYDPAGGNRSDPTIRYLHRRGGAARAWVRPAAGPGPCVGRDTGTGARSPSATDHQRRHSAPASDLAACDRCRRSGRAAGGGPRS
jgi:hypothetical protein